MTGDQWVITEPGIYDGMPAEVYHADPVPGGSLSSSGARRLLPPSCPALFRYGEVRQTKAMEIGTAAHARILGVGAEIVEVPDLLCASNGAWSTSEAKAFVAAAREAGQVPVKPEEYQRIKAMAAAVGQHKTARQLFEPGSGLAEQSIFWTDPETGVWRRARLDFLPHGANGMCIIPDYKLLARDTPLPTPSGWTTMGAVRVGDQLIGADGKPCTVTGKSPVQWPDCYRIRFDDKSEVVCGGEHLWETTTGRGRYKTRTGVHSTVEIRRALKLYGQAQHRVRLAGPLDLLPAKLPVDSWVLGYWLGNGTRGDGQVTTHADDASGVTAAAIAAGYKVGAIRPRKGTKAVSVRILGLSRMLTGLGVSGYKHVPAIYLRASASQRTALLRGLFDSDGSWNATRQQAVFSSTSKQLALDVRELALSLGQRAVLHTIDAYGFGKHVTAYQVTFTPLGGLVPFALPRKAKQVEVTKTQAFSSRRIIQAVDSVLTVPAQCVTVDSPDSTYLCTEAMIPTHNTSVSAHPDAVAKAIANYGYDKQFAWYSDAVRWLRPGAEVACMLVVQETSPPYLVGCYQLDGRDLDAAARQNRLALEIYRDCTASGVWPGYDPYEGFQTIRVPRWARGYDDEW